VEGLKGTSAYGKSAAKGREDDYGLDREAAYSLVGGAANLGDETLHDPVLMRGLSSKFKERATGDVIDV